LYIIGPEEYSAGVKVCGGGMGSKFIGGMGSKFINGGPPAIGNIDAVGGGGGGGSGPGWCTYEGAIDGGGRGSASLNPDAFNNGAISSIVAGGTYPPVFTPGFIAPSLSCLASSLIKGERFLGRFSNDLLRVRLR